MTTVSCVRCNDRRTVPDNIGINSYPEDMPCPSCTDGSWPNVLTKLEGSATPSPVKPADVGMLLSPIEKDFKDHGALESMPVRIGLMRDILLELYDHRRYRNEANGAAVNPMRVHIRDSINRQLGDDPFADRIILAPTDWDIVLEALGGEARKA